MLEKAQELFFEAWSHLCVLSGPFPHDLCHGRDSPRWLLADDRGWDGWMVSPTRWTWVWAISGNFWWTGKPGMLQSMRSQRVRHDWATEMTDHFMISMRFKWDFHYHLNVISMRFSFSFKCDLNEIFQKFPHLVCYHIESLFSEMQLLAAFS